MSARKNQQKKSTLAVAASLLPCLLVPTLVFGQAVDSGATRLERVEITGSSIKRIEGETALPVQILKREDIQRSGATSTEELVKQLSSLSTGGSITTASTATGSGAGSIATVSLRGLGGGRTLVLVNGRRVSVYGGGSAGAAGSSVDINSIPLAAIERVEVLKDGASAIYGSDAIAGVVNFIMRKDFTGVELSGTYGQPTLSPGHDRKASLFAGFGKLAEDGYNINFGINLQKVDPIFGSDRPFASRINVENQNDVLSSIAFPANVFVYGSNGVLKNPNLPDCGPVSQVSPYSPTRCSFDNSPYISLQPQSEKANLMLNGRLALSGDAEAYFESSFNRTTTTTTTQPVPISYINPALPATNPYSPIFKNMIATQYPILLTKPYAGSFTNAAFLLPPSSPYYPAAFAAANGMAGLPLALNYRDVANGPRTTADQADNARLMTGMRGTFAGWDLDTGVLYSQTKVRQTLLTGWAQTSKILPILNSGIINPFGPTADPAALAAARATDFVGTSYSTKTSVLGIDAKASREIYTLAAGAVNLAVGGEVRKEKFQYDPSLAIQTADISGLGGTAFPVSGSRNVGSAFAEINVPLMKKLDADFAVRYDNYQGVGDTVNPKASVRWQPSDQILVRSSIGSGFRAPSLTDLNTPQATNITANGTRDPIRCPDIKTGAPSDCSNQFNTISGGNPNLMPEKSLSYTFGILFEPIKDFSLGFDAFRVNLKNSINVAGINYTYFLANADRATKFASFITRGAPDGNASGVGPITAISQTAANLFKVQLSGVDIDGKYALRLATGDKFTFRMSGTYLDKYDIQGPDGSYSSALDQAVNASSGVILRWKHSASVSYDKGPWGASLSQNYQKSYTDVLGNRAPAGSTPRDVDAYQTFDLQGTYSGIKSTKFALGVKNLTDRIPPYTNVTSNFLGGYDVSYGDPRGRFVYVTATYTYK